ncbi:MAG: alpha-1,2-fucosyltransferase [Verrucomicrobiales bacterium]|nr:alpha-1,2-fucosyltransferase [Verrucomicrobiales bacterium]
MTPPKNQKLFTIGRRCGRLANRLIIFANFIALAEEQGDRVINYTFHSYSDLFEATRENVHCAYPVPKKKSWLDRIPGVGAAIRKTRIFYHFTRYASVLIDRFPILGRKVVTLCETEGQFITYLDSPEVQEKIRPAKIVFVYDWRFRAPNLMQKHGDKIRAYFRPLETFEKASREVVEPLRHDADIVIGVHVRHGDYRGWKGGKYFYPVECYAAWMRDLVTQFPGRKVSFLVCSDERRNAGEFPGLTVGFGTKSPVTDLFALARCDYIVGTKSTFPQWASFYGGKPLLQILDRNAPVKVEDFRVCYLDWD